MRFTECSERPITLRCSQQAVSSIDYGGNPRCSALSLQVVLEGAVAAPNWTDAVQIGCAHSTALHGALRILGSISVRLQPFLMYLVNLLFTG